MVRVETLEGPEDLRSLGLLAEKDLLVVGALIAQMLLFVAVLGCLGQVINLHLFEGLRETNEEIVDPELGDVSRGLTLDLTVVDGLELMELLIVFLIQHLLKNFLRETVTSRVHIY